MLNREHPELRRWGEELSTYTVWFALRAGLDADGAYMWSARLMVNRGCERRRELAKFIDLPIDGLHDVENALAAAAGALAFRVEFDQIAGGLAGFRPLPHRMELVARSRGVKFIDDSASTTPERSRQHIADSVQQIMRGFPPGSSE